MFSFLLELLLSFSFFIISFSFSPPADWLSWIGCISHHEANILLQHRSTKFDLSQPPLSVLESINLGFNKIPLYLVHKGINIENSWTDEKLILTWEELDQIASKKSGCYAIYDDGSQPWKVKTLSQTTNLPASLCPPISRSGAPTLLLGGFTMHRIAGEEMDPMVDTTNKMSAVTIRPGYRILDTCMGLGYTAIAAARKVNRSEGSVVTFEYDIASLEMACHNPWSRQLFDKSLPISIKQGDACELISKSFNRKLGKESTVDVIIHDPPAKALCRKDLYSVEFYQDMFDALRPSGGQLFHYIGNPDSKESGRLYRGVVDRLRQVGFKEVRESGKAFGVVAIT